MNRDPKDSKSYSYLQKLSMITIGKLTAVAVIIANGNLFDGDSSTGYMLSITLFSGLATGAILVVRRWVANVVTVPVTYSILGLFFGAAALGLLYNPWDFKALGLLTLICIPMTVYFQNSSQAHKHSL